MKSSRSAAGVDPTVPAPAVELVGLAAYTELAEFGLLAARSVDAPDLATRQALADGADRALGRQRALLALVSADDGVVPGVVGAAVMAPFDDALTDFDARTDTDDWAEGLLKGVVGHGVAQDFCRVLAGGLDGSSGRAVRQVLERPAPGPEAGADAGADAEAIWLLARLAAADDVLGSRLALWGRRVVGEALGVVTALLGRRPELAALAAESASRSGVDLPPAPDRDDAVRTWLVARLTGEHTRRMDRMRLAA
ncbi:ferritin-like fold-containing protein [Isoptericola halotolerans]|uniref:ferritin-like fold-containing protein n=1 Tax=Isoptericola halotolerans TaxID=300560 RepID=UPI00388E929F